MATNSKRHVEGMTENIQRSHDVALPVVDGGHHTICVNCFAILRRGETTLVFKRKRSKTEREPKRIRKSPSRPSALVGARYGSHKVYVVSG